MISGGKAIKSIDSVREIVNPCLKELEPAFRNKVKAALDSYCTSEAGAKLSGLPSNVSARAKAFGSASDYATSSPISKLANVIMDMSFKSMENAGELLAGLVKAGFTNEGGKNG